MVTIKIQSRGDIIGAYLQTLGFDREKSRRSFGRAFGLD